MANQIYEQLVEAGFTPGEAKDVVAMIKEVCHDQDGE